MKDFIEAIIFACESGYISKDEAKRRIKQIIENQIGK